MPGSVLEIERLTKIYRRSHLGRVQETVGVRELTLSISEGEIFGLLGLNGAGKTTTLKLILGLLHPTEGDLRLFGRPLPDPQAVQSVGFLPEAPYFPRVLTVEEVLRFYGRLSGLEGRTLEDRMRTVLGRVRMEERKSKRVRECSKGMLQRLSLAQALVHDPRLLILDEPITGLDPLGLNEMRELILELNRQGKTILFSSHIIAEVERIAHRVGILVEGRLVRILTQGEWGTEPGRLERLFVQILKEHHADAI